MVRKRECKDMEKRMKEKVWKENKTERKRKMKRRQRRKGKWWIKKQRKYAE